MRTYNYYSPKLILSLFVFILFALTTSIQAQEFQLDENYTSIRHEQSTYYEENEPESSDVMPMDAFEQLKSSFAPYCSEEAACGMKKQVYGVNKGITNG